MEIPSFLARQHFPLLLFGGKGGVGKTTCATAAGFWMADHFADSSTLLVSIDPAHSLADSLAGDPPPANLTLLEIDAGRCLESFKGKYGRSLHGIAARGTFLDDEDITRILELSLPGLDELMAFLEISRWVRDGRYESVLVDTAPSGHTVRMLEMPELIGKWLDVLDSLLAKHRYMKQVFGRTNHRDDLDQFLEELALSVNEMEILLRDPARCRFIPVMRAETLSVRETVDLIKELKRFRLPVTDLIVNGLYPENTCASCKTERAHQMKALAELSHYPIEQYPIWSAPMYAVEVQGERVLRSFWQRITRLEIPPFPSRDSTLAKWHRTIQTAEPPPAEVRLLLFGGKGGVGKTTLACATAVWIAREYPEKRVLLLSADPAHSLSNCLDIPVGLRPTAMFPGLTAMEIDSKAEFELLKNQYAVDLENFFSAASSNIDLPFDRQVMEDILDLAPPGLDEIMALSRITELLAANSYDIFVVDSASTGHLVRLLELPALINEWLLVFFNLILKYRKIFPLPGFSQQLVEFSKSFKKLRVLLTDRTEAHLYVVSIPTEMAYEETKDLLSATEAMGMHVPALFLNLVTPRADCDFCTALCERESRVMRRFEESFPNMAINRVYRQREPRGIPALGAFADGLYLPAGKEAAHSVS